MENKEANTEVVEKDINTMVDEHFDNLEATSASKETTGEETETAEATGTDQSKTTEAEAETETLSSEEEKLKKIAEILGDDEKAIEAYIKKHGYHKDPAWQKLLAKSKTPAIDEETQKQLETFKQVTSSPEYIRASMKAQGYTEEAINGRLKDLGHEVIEKGLDDFALVASKLNVDPKTIEGSKELISDIAKIADIIFQDRVGKILPGQLKPLQETVQSITNKEAGKELYETMQKTVTNEGILDFDKDIKPGLAKFLDDNPKATQADIKNHFIGLNHKISIERLKTKGRKDVRDEKKDSMRTLDNKATTPQGKIEGKRANETQSQFLDRILDAHDIK